MMTRVGSNLLAFLLVSVAGYLFQRPVRCAMDTNLTVLRLLFWLGGTLAVSIGLRKVWFAPGALLAAFVYLLLFGFGTDRLPAGCCDRCVVADGDLITVASALVSAEETAVLTEDQGKIDAIYYKWAAVTDVSKSLRQDARTHYAEMFQTLKFTNLVHTTPTLILNQTRANEFQVSTISFGEFRSPRDSPQPPMRFQGVDHWTIARDHHCCCWRIKTFAFNVNR